MTAAAPEGQAKDSPSILTFQWKFHHAALETAIKDKKLFCYTSFGVQANQPR